MMALACANASVLPLAYQSYAANHWQLPAAVDVSHYGHWAGAPAAVDVSHHGYDDGQWRGHGYYQPAYSYANQWSAPSVYAYDHGHAYAAHDHGHAYAHAVAPVAHHGATYTAKTRGAVHTAPLPGHVLSQTSLNVAPAPGTW
jgi:Cuticle protein